MEKPWAGIMKTFNITAMIYDKTCPVKQTIFMNEIIIASCEQDATDFFTTVYSKTHHIVKIYSTEEVSQVVA